MLLRDGNQESRPPPGERPPGTRAPVLVADEHLGLSGGVGRSDVSE